MPENESKSNLFDRKYDILMKEWGFIQDKVIKYDAIVFSIRGWAVSVWTACLIFAAKDDEPLIMLLCVIPLLVFWLVDSLNKSFQRKFIKRVNEIEEYLSSAQFENDFLKQEFTGITGPNLRKLFAKRGDGTRIKEVLAAANLRNVKYVYLSLVLASLISFAYLKYAQ